jgi:hypothetical protein
MKRKDKVCDMSLFSIQSIDDWDVNDIIDYAGFDSETYAKLDDAVIPKMYRLFNVWPLADAQKLVSDVKEEYSRSNLKDIVVDNSVYISEEIDMLSISKALSIGNKDKVFRVDDFNIMKSFDKASVRAPKTNEELSEAKYSAFDSIMKDFDNRRFQKSAIENAKESLEFAIHDYLENAICRYDEYGLLMIRGLHQAEYFIRKIVGKRNFSENTWKMLSFAYAIDERKYSGD